MKNLSSAGKNHTEEQMKVWLMNHYAADMFRDKAGRHFWFAKKLEEFGCQPTVFCASSFHNTSEGIELSGKKYRVLMDVNTPFVFVKTTPSKRNGLDRVKNMFQFFFNLFIVTKAYARENGKPDVIIASSVHPLTMVAGVFIANRMTVPCVCEIRDLWPEAIFSFGRLKPKSILGRILTVGEHWIYRKADALIFTKEGDTDYIREKKWDTDHGGDIDLQKCHYINNGVNLSVFDAQTRENVLADEDLGDSSSFNVTYAGMIRPVNNVGNILDCAALLRDNTNIHFLVYGEGSELEMLRMRVKVEHLDNVKIKGFIYRKFIPYVLSRSSVNILNYDQNKYNWSRGNSSNKLFEYMASGKPVISTVRMGYSIIDKYACGIELAHNSPEALADAILRITQLTNVEYSMICRNARIGAEDFDYNHLIIKLMFVIHGIIPPDKRCVKMENA